VWQKGNQWFLWIWSHLKIAAKRQPTGLTGLFNCVQIFSPRFLISLACSIKHLGINLFTLPCKLDHFIIVHYFLMTIKRASLQKIYKILSSCPRLQSARVRGSWRERNQKWFRPSFLLCIGCIQTFPDLKTRPCFSPARKFVRNSAPC